MKFIIKINVKLSILKYSETLEFNLYQKKSNRMRQEMIRMIGWYGWYPASDSISIWHALYSRVSL